MLPKSTYVTHSVCISVQEGQEEEGQRYNCVEETLFTGMVPTGKTFGHFARF